MKGRFRSFMVIVPLSKNHEKLIRKLQAKKYRLEEELFLAEGAHALTEALKGSLYALREIILAEDLLEEKENALSGLPLPSDIPVYSCSRRVMASLSTEESPQGILLVLSGRAFTFDELTDRPSRRLVYLDEVSDPGNLGTIFRTALWFGFRQFLLGPDCVDHFNTQTIRASAGALFGSEIYRPVESGRLLKYAKENNYTVTATVPRGGIPVDKWAPAEKEIILFGQEARGLSADLIEGADCRITIPGSGAAESLNLAAAAAIILYEAARFRRRTGD